MSRAYGFECDLCGLLALAPVNDWLLIDDEDNGHIDVGPECMEKPIRELMVHVEQIKNNRALLRADNEYSVNLESE